LTTGRWSLEDIDNLTEGKEGSGGILFGGGGGGSLLQGQNKHSAVNRFTSNAGKMKSESLCQAKRINFHR
jgi:hypothetical protein